MPRRAARVDKNQTRVTEELRGCGLSVALTHTVGSGFPDMVVGATNINYLVELKSSRNATLTDDEDNFHNKWPGQLAIHYGTLDIISGFLIYTIRLKNEAATRKLLAALALYISKYHDESVD